MALPGQNDITNAATTAAVQTEFEDQRDFISTMLGGAARTELTIGSGTTTPAVRDHGGIFTVDTESDAASDDLDTIANTNIGDGQLIMLAAETGSRVVTLKHGDGGTGEMIMFDSADFVLDATDKWIMFRRENAAFIEVDRNYGVDLEGAHANLEIVPVLSGSVLCPHEALVVAYATAATVTIAADSLVLSNAAGFQKAFASVSETVDITVSGVGGLDTGSESSGAATWYHLYIIGQADGTVDGLLSLSATAPTLPSGYTFYGYVGAIQNTAANDFIEIYQTGNMVACVFVVYASNSYPGTTLLSTAITVPATARIAGGEIAAMNAAGSNGVCSAGVASTSSATGLMRAGGYSTVNGNNPFRAGWRVLLVTAQTVWVNVTASDDRMLMTLTSWEY